MVSRVQFLFLRPSSFLRLWGFDTFNCIFVSVLGQCCRLQGRTQETVDDIMTRKRRMKELPVCEARPPAALYFLMFSSRFQDHLIFSSLSFPLIPPIISHPFYYLPSIVLTPIPLIFPPSLSLSPIPLIISCPFYFLLLLWCPLSLSCFPVLLLYSSLSSIQ